MAAKECHLVTGGGGYAGVRLGRALHEKGHRVILVDVNEPVDVLPEDIKFIKVDIRDFEGVKRALQGANCVYHLASYGMSGREQLNKKRIEEVNICGTHNVIKACVDLAIDRLVYTSTYNVVFGGQVIENGDERLPYLPLDLHPDHYSRTKSIAEKAIIEANGTCLEKGQLLKTCALRLAGVYGPGEQRHIPRIVRYIERGYFCVVHGDADSLVEFLHIDNFVQAHVKAAEALRHDRKSIAAGEAYFISDCKPVNNFKFFQPLVEGLGYTYPRIRLPMTLVYYIAFLIEMIHGVIGQIYNFQPLLTCTEVYKTGVTHYFSNEKAKRHLGYLPTVQNDMDSVVNWYKERGYGRQTKSKSSSFNRLLVDFILMAVFTALVLSFIPFAK